MNQDFESLVKKCSDDIRAGRADVAIKTLISMNASTIPRRFRLPIAHLCRRAGLTRLGLRVLAPVTRPEKTLAGQRATREESAEYAILILKNGSPREALELLNSLDVSDFPEIDLYRGFCHIIRWESASAIERIEAFLATEPTGDLALVAKTNLTAALINEGRYDAGVKNADVLIAETERANHRRLLGNALEMRGQIHLHLEQFDRCRDDLERAKSILDHETSIDQLFTQKWLAILRGRRDRDPEPIESFRAEAVRRGHWESVRECDFHTLRIAFNAESFNRLYFGTPYPSYRMKLEKEYGLDVLRNAFVIGDPSGPVLDLMSGALNGAQSELKPGRKIHQMIQALLRDLYRPVSVGALFAELFCDERFDPFNSHGRIHQILYRTREWISENQFAMSIEESENMYRIQINGSFGFVLSREPAILDADVIACRKLYSVFGEFPFAGEEARQVLGVSKTTFHQLSVRAIRSSRMKRKGLGRAVRYSLNINAEAS